MADKQNSKQVYKQIFGIIAYILTAVLLILIFMCNREIVFMQDDLWYSTNLVTEEKISGVRDIVQSQIWHYFNWGGRTVAHTLLQFLLWGGGTFCNILNTVAFVLLAVFIGKSGRKMNIWPVLLSGALLVVVNPQLIDTLFWQSGTANYLYMTLLTFPFVWLYLNTLQEKEGKEINPVTGIFASLGTLLWGILSGWTNENFGPTIFLITVFCIVYAKRKKKKIPAWMITGSIGTAIGSAVMILAPGNSVRNEQIHTLGSWKLDLCKRVVDYFRAAFEYLLPIVLITVFVYVMYRLVMKKLPDLPTLVVLLAGIVAFLALAASPHVPERSTFGVMAFFIWANVSMLSQIFDETKKEKYRYLITILISMIAIHRLFFMFALSVGWYRYE
ncbi:MAG: hypothetical protein IKO32_12570 [Lachnospiraceae bacterium]|nr:hypothetical protein [Lachnospiraceae bacterium]